MRTLDLKTVAEMAQGTLLTGAGCPESAPITEIIRDSREASRGRVFVAIKGERLDGHQFVERVFAQGAQAAIISKPVQEVFPEGVPAGKALILVEDTVKALGRLGRAYKRLMEEAAPEGIRSVGVTGSVGKTSCKDMIAAALSGGLKTVKTIGNLNNHIGVPLTLLSIERDTRAAVIEMGMNHFGEIDYSASLAEPEMGVITNVGTAHIENLGSREGIRQAKLEIVPHLKKGPLFVNGDDDMLRAVKDELPVAVKTFGFGENNDARILVSEITPQANLHVVIDYAGETYDLRLNTMGRHMALNAAPAIMIGREVGLPKEEILQGLASLEPTGHRMEVVRTGRFVIIDDTYNANPVSMKAAIDALTEVPAKGRRVAVLGDMFELGNYAKAGHGEIGRYAAEAGVDVLVACGPESIEMIKAAEAVQPERSAAETAGLKPLECHYFEQREILDKNVLSILQDDDIILLKASHGMAFTETLNVIGGTRA